MTRRQNLSAALSRAGLTNQHWTPATYATDAEVRVGAVTIQILEGSGYLVSYDAPFGLFGETRPSIASAVEYALSLKPKP